MKAVRSRYASCWGAGMQAAREQGCKLWGAGMQVVRNKDASCEEQRCKL